ncbi:MAG TPA: hypothetical protein DEO89_06415 [Lachnospiraceae bacterium]|nr:hypothetical protein [Lachnospiraceae bacterium]
MVTKGAKKRAAIAFAAALVVSSIGYVPEADAESVAAVTGDYSQEVNEICDTLEYVVSDPASGSAGGEWAALVLGRTGRMTEGWKERYLVSVKNSLDAKSETLKAENKLHAGKSTDNSRTIIGLYSAGADVTCFNGWNLCAPLAGDHAGGDKTEQSADYEYTKMQGINGPVFALIALDYAGYYSENEIKVTDLTEENVTTLRDDYIDYILAKELQTGGWAFSGSDADPDVTMMAVQALSKYTYLSEVNDAVERALTAMSAQQNADGGFVSWGTVNSESIAQVICGLTMLGIDPTKDERFIKNGKTVVDALKSFGAVYKDTPYRGYGHTGTDYNQMATEQAGYAMVALWCQRKGEKLYQSGYHDISDLTPTVTPTAVPTTEPAAQPTVEPTEATTATQPTVEPTEAPATAAPTLKPTETPSSAPAAKPSPKTDTTAKLTKFSNKVTVKKGGTVTINTVVNGKKVKCKIFSYNKKYLSVKVKNGKLIVKAGKKAKAGKTYKVVIKYKKGKKMVKKTIKIKVR